MLNNYALIIGVEDYSAYDRSKDQPAGTSHVGGAVNDARFEAASSPLSSCSEGRSPWPRKSSAYIQAS